MNTSDLRLRAESTTIDAFSFAGLSLPDEIFGEIRMSLYHSSGPGYHVFTNFLSPQTVAHIRTLWATAKAEVSHQPFVSKQEFRPGCPNFYSQDGLGNRTFYNFLWNEPLDEVTHAVSVCVQMLRNRVSGRGPFAEVFPFGRKAVSYRVVLTRNAEKWVAPHRDYADEQRRFEKNRYDPSRLQATLVLSQKGVDYGGVGFVFERNDGRRVVFGSDVEVVAGDLVVWRYNNLHSVEKIVTAPDQFGFMRIIYPPEDLQPEAPSVPAGRERSGRLKAVFRRAAQLFRR